MNTDRVGEQGGVAVRGRCGNPAAFFGIALGLAAPLSLWGWTAVPGALCCAIAIACRAYVKLAIAGLLLCAVLGAASFPFWPIEKWAPDWLQRHYANQVLREFRAPTLPASARDIRYRYAMGLMDRYFALRFRSDPIEAETFLAGLHEWSGPDIVEAECDGSGVVFLRAEDHF